MSSWCPLVLCRHGEPFRTGSLFSHCPFGILPPLSGAVSSEVSPLFPPGCCSSRAVFPWGVPAAPHSIGMKGAGNPARFSWVRSSLHGGFLLCGEEGAAVGAFTRQQLLEHELLKPLHGTGPALLSLLTHKSECERQFFHF